MTRPASALVALGLAYGALVTIANVPPEDFVADDSPRRTLSLVLNALAAWAGIAVFAGWFAGSWRRGLFAGPALLIPALVSYYVVGTVAGSEDFATEIGELAFLIVVSLTAGPLLGAIGARLRGRDLLGLVCALVIPVAAVVEVIARTPVAIQPDPARPAADVIVLVLAALGGVLALGRYLVTPRSSAV